MLKIAYSGSLDGKYPANGRSGGNSLKKWLWTYRHDTVNSVTRSGFYFIQAVKLLKERYKVSPEQLSVEWWGKIDPLNSQQVSEAGVEQYFNISGYISKQESIEKMKEADLFFLPLERSNVPGQGTLFIPGKLFEYINIGKPVLALCDESDCKEILCRSGLGLFASPDNPEEIAFILNEVIEGRTDLNSFKADQDYIATHSFRQKAKELASVFDNLLKN